MNNGVNGMQLSDLGERICILGPAGSGKSTLADAIARKQGLEAIHLDQLYHLPNTDWQIRPEADFLALHARAIAGSRWVMDGNYSKCLPQRLQRATGLILLDVSILTSLFRYVRRSLADPHRIGALAGGHDSIKWVMIRHIVFIAPGNRRRYAEMFGQLALPKVSLPSSRALRTWYQDIGLDRRRVVQ